MKAQKAYKIYNYDSYIFLDPDLATAYPDLDTLASLIESTKKAH